MNLIQNKPTVSILSCDQNITDFIIITCMSYLLKLQHLNKHGNDKHF